MLDDSAELIVGQAINEMFRVFQKVIDDKAKISQHADQMIGKDISIDLIEEVLAY